MFKAMCGATAATSSCRGPGVRSAVQRGSSVAPAARRTKVKMQPPTALGLRVKGSGFRVSLNRVFGYTIL